MLASFPSLTKLDLSYNMISGTFPLDELADLPRLKRVNVDNNHLDNINQPKDGGFNSLLYFNIDYNRNLTGPFPAAFGAMPKLEYLSIHDTHFIGKLPTQSRAFSSADTLLFSGSYVCGNLPPVCFHPVAGREDAAFCDVVEGGKSVLEPCNGTDGLIGGGSPMPKIRLGAAARQFSDAPFLVYMTVLTALGFEIEPVHDLPHADLYPLFTETPRTENTVDVVITSDLPNNHGTFLIGKHETFNVIGTSYNPLITGLASPIYSRIDSIEALAESTTVNKTILSYVSLTLSFKLTPTPTPTPTPNSHENRTWRPALSAPSMPKSGRKRACQASKSYQSRAPAQQHLLRSDVHQHPALSKFASWIPYMSTGYVSNHTSPSVPTHMCLHDSLRPTTPTCTHRHDEMQVAVASMVGANEEFAVVSFNTDGLLAGQGLKMLDMEEFTRDLNNQGKVLVRKDAHWKLGPKGIAMLGAVYIPSHDVSAMDLKVGEGQQAQEVAAEWVATNKYIVDSWGWGSTTNL